MKLSPWVLDADASVSRAVEDELRWAPDVPSDAIRATVGNGVTTLSGTVCTCAERRRAIETSLDVPGVEAVVEEFTIRPRDGAQHTDAELHRAIQANLRWHCELAPTPFAWT